MSKHGKTRESKSRLVLVLFSDWSIVLRMPSHRPVFRKIHPLFSKITVLNQRVRSLLKSACVFLSAQFLYHLTAHPII